LTKVPFTAVEFIIPAGGAPNISAVVFKNNFDAPDCVVPAGVNVARYEAVSRAGSGIGQLNAGGREKPAGSICLTDNKVGQGGAERIESMTAMLKTFPRIFFNLSINTVHRAIRLNLRLTNKYLFVNTLIFFQSVFQLLL